MRIINTIITVIVLLLLIVLVPVVLAAPDWFFGQAFDLVSTLNREIGQLSNSQPLILYGGGAVIEILLLVLLFFELKPRPKDKARIRLQGGGTAEIAFAPVKLRLEQNVKSIPGVRRADATVSAQGRKLKASYDVVVGPNAAVRNVQNKIEVATEHVIETQMGLKLHSKPNVNIKLAGQAEEQVPEPAPPEPASNPAPPFRPPGGFTVPDDTTEL